MRKIEREETEDTDTRIGELRIYTDARRNLFYKETKKPGTQEVLTTNQPFLASARLRPSGTRGMERRRMPVALKMALPTAGAMGTMGGSPAAAEGRALGVGRTTSGLGRSGERGRGESAMWGVEIVP